MLSYSNFGADTSGSPVKVHGAVNYMQKEYPELAIDGEMQVNFAMNRELRDAKYPFTRLKGKDVNTLIFPNLSSANAGYKLLQAMDPDTEFIGPIQMGLIQAGERILGVTQFAVHGKVHLHFTVDGEFRIFLRKL